VGGGGLVTTVVKEQPKRASKYTQVYTSRRREGGNITSIKDSAEMSPNLFASNQILGKSREDFKEKTTKGAGTRKKNSRRQAPEGFTYVAEVETAEQAGLSEDVHKVKNSTRIHNYELSRVARGKAGGENLCTTKRGGAKPAAKSGAEVKRREPEEGIPGKTGQCSSRTRQTPATMQTRGRNRPHLVNDGRSISKNV